MIARVIIDLKVKTLDRLFDYIVPKQFNNILEKGMRVIVPFGMQTRLGYVIDIIDSSSVATKKIAEVLDVIPTISKESFDYIDYLLKTNQRMLIETVETIIPSELFLKYNKEIHIINKKAISKELTILFKNKDYAVLNNEFLQYKSEITKLINNKDVVVKTVYATKGSAKMIKALVYNKDHSYLRVNNYLDLVDYVIKTPKLRRVDLINEGFNGSAINTLIRNEVFLVKEIRQMRDVNFLKQDKIPLHTLNKEQKNAYNQIANKINEYSVSLLHGITGSGKTEVYMHLMRDVLNNNKKVLYLVPEITLIAPLVQQLKSRFNEEITHYNSNLSSGERYDAWSKIINNDAKIIVGTRSSVFLPIEDIGLIVIDEEHDSSYTQTEGVQYKIIDIVKMKAKHHNAPILMGSATPSVETMYYAKNSTYQLLELTKRATKQDLPKIHYIDMKEELKAGNTKVFSNILYDKINERLAKKEQVILLFNRKGFAPFVMCRSCGYTPKCKSCDVSLTYYRQKDELRCHHCGHSEANLEQCPICKSNAIKAVGVGVEHIEYQVKRHFKKARVIRMDATTTTKRGSHEAIWNAFKNYEYDILIGTQMISKGLDFPKVTLVGVLMADLSLKVPSYLASEQTYALLTQMTGRSGRKIAGEAVIQGYNLDHYAIKAVEKGYDYFYKEALFERRISKYIPFYKVSQILVSSKSYLSAFQIAANLKSRLLNEYEIILGPAESIYRYIRGEYRFVITIKDKLLDPLFIFNEIEKLENKNAKIYYYSIPEIM